MKLAPTLAVLVSIVLAAMAGPAAAAKPKLSVGDVVIDESGSSAKVTVTASRAPKREASVGFSSVDQTAAAGQDYSATSGRLKIPAGKRSAKLAVPLTRDQADEPDESFLVRLSGPKRAKVFDGESTVTIRDDDPLPRLSITTTSVPEGDASLDRAESASSDAQAPHDLTVQLDRPSSRLVSVAYATSPGTATEREFAAGSGTVVIPAGQAAGTIPLATRGDLTDEFDEVLTIVLSNPQGLEPAEPAYPVTIVDDDPEPTIRLATTTVQEGTSGNAIRNVLVSLGAGSEKPIGFDFATAPGTATSPADFAPIAGHFSSPGFFGLTTVGDYDDEPNETLTVEFSSPVNVNLPASPQTITIIDDDLACVTPDTPTSPPPVNLGTVNGDTDNAPHVITAPAPNEISPCGDADWFGFTLHEDSGSTVDLTAKLVLQSAANDSPSNGDVNVCAQQGVGGTPACAPAIAGQDEVLDVCVNDIAGDQSTALLVKVSGTGNAVNHYSLTITGHTAPSGGVELNLGC
jgi:hypothetical protein